MNRRDFLKYVSIFILAILLKGCWGCNFDDPLESNSTPEDAADALAAWQQDPNLNVHIFDTTRADNDPEGQMYYILKLRDSGNLSWVRIGLLDQSGTQIFASRLSQHGIQILGIFSNDLLRSPNVTQLFSHQVLANPQIRYWEIGNEVSMPAFFSDGRSMEPAEYMDIYKKIFYHAREQHPGIRLMPQSDFFPEMIKLGLPELVRDGSMVALHIYHKLDLNGLEIYKSHLLRLTSHAGRKPRVWVTETGIDAWDKHIKYAAKIYPEIKRVLGVEKIFWYCLTDNTDFSLVKGLANRQPPIIFSPFYEIIIGGQLQNSPAEQEIFESEPTPSPNLILRRGNTNRGERKWKERN